MSTTSSMTDRELLLVLHERMAQFETQHSHVRQLLTNIEQRLASHDENAVLNFDMTISDKLEKIMLAINSIHGEVNQEALFYRSVIEHLIG